MLKDPRPGVRHCNQARKRSDMIHPDPRRSAALAAVDATRVEKRRALPDDALACNCAGCTIELAVDPSVAARCGADAVAGRVDGRPYCGACYPAIRR